jgi:hypothetical protein
MKKITFLGIIMLLSLFTTPAKAQIYYDLTTVGGSVTMGYDAVNTEQAKAIDARWITAVSFPATNASGKCSSVSSTFNITNSRSLEFWLAKCDAMTINANIATGRGITYSIDGATPVALAGTNACNDFVVPINKEVPCKIKITGGYSTSAYVSLFKFTYAPKVPTINSFVINGYSATIDQTNKTITLQLPYGTDITAVTPVVTLGGTAVGNPYSPTGAQNFSSGPVTYIVTDNTTPVNYTANITVKSTPDTDKAITSLTINGRSATINETTGAISCDFPSFTGALGNWPVAFTLSGTTCQANFTTATSYNFSTNNTLTITVTAQDLSTKVYTVTPTISTKKNIGILSLNGKAETYDNLLVSALSDYFVTFLPSGTAPADINAFYSNYDLIVFHANVSGTDATGLASKAMVGVKPILNLKAFFYNSGRWSWSTTAPGNSAAGVGSADVQVNLQNHPIFANVNFSGTTLSYYDNLPAANTNAVQYASDLATITSGLNSKTIATFNTSGIQIHEIQDNIAAKYLLVGLSIENNNYTYFNANTINVLKNAAAYLLNPTAKYNYTTTSLNNMSEKNPVYYNNNTIYNPDQQSIVIYNTSGMKIKTSKEKAINTQSLAKGIYMVQTADMKVLKFIK